MRGRWLEESSKGEKTGDEVGDAAMALEAVQGV